MTTAAKTNRSLKAYRSEGGKVTSTLIESLRELAAKWKAAAQNCDWSGNRSLNYEAAALRKCAADLLTLLDASRVEPEEPAREELVALMPGRPSTLKVRVEQIEEKTGETRGDRRQLSPSDHGDLPQPATEKPPTEGA